MFEVGDNLYKAYATLLDGELNSKDGGWAENLGDNGADGYLKLVVQHCCFCWNLFSDFRFI